MNAASRRFEIDDRKVARAAAKVSNKHRRGGFLFMRIEIGGGNRLHDVIYFFKPEPAERGFVPLLGKRRIWIWASEFNRPADNEPRRQTFAASRRVRSDPFEKGGQDIFEKVSLSIDRGVLEGRIGGVSLERLKETRVRWKFDKVLDCPRTGLATGLRGPFTSVLPKAQYGTERGKVLGPMPELRCLHAAIRLPGSQHRVGCAKIDAYGRTHAIARKLDIGSRRRRRLVAGRLLRHAKRLWMVLP